MVKPIHCLMQSHADPSLQAAYMRTYGAATRAEHKPSHLRMKNLLLMNGSFRWKWKLIPQITIHHTNKF